MSLLREIQNAAVDSQSDLPTLLRKCKILASRLDFEPFKQWIDQELNGYKHIEDLPDYRILTVRSYGHFFGSFGRKLTNAPIALTCLPEQFRDKLQHSYLQSPISIYSSLLSTRKDENLQEQWPPDLLAFYGTKIFEDMNCLQAWKAIPRASIAALLDTVRTRILNFVLEIENEAPDAGEAMPKSKPVPEETATQIFNTYILGTVQNVATGCSDVKQQAEATIGLTAEAFNNLIDAISSASSHNEVQQELIEVIKEMQASKDRNSLLVGYNKFMSILSDNMSVFGPLVAPYLPMLAKLLS